MASDTAIIISPRFMGHLLECVLGSPSRFNPGRNKIPLTSPPAQVQRSKPAAAATGSALPGLLCRVAVWPPLSRVQSGRLSPDARRSARPRHMCTLAGGVVLLSQRTAERDAFCVSTGRWRTDHESAYRRRSIRSAASVGRSPLEIATAFAHSGIPQ
jgi:hypothetical protein